ncbi:heat shock 70 kDa protein 12A-like [Mercenaria mercenaria]|uniref:heat shock 70 kDa protein 12A-like n=1 Tax=Mercenaria mercenaria TaxID=6596 RepID=UPI00234EAAC9|nr:heat shock 70 kDa protein 12A-like [Mercenaria mercenaria]XP_045210216.2 heat shock 70 kDa protein 12A-like [Mercenaria mercenaria]
MSNHLLVAAIDFGTTFSSWGFSFKHEYDLEPTKVTAKQWTGLQSAVSLKGPTTILIKPDGKTIDSFGFDAETKYAELAEDQKHKEWYFFKRFKMQLFDKIGLRRDFTIDDATGKALQAKTVFSLSIRYLKDDLMDMSKRQLLDQHLMETDIHWVLTVPAIWNDVAKQFMRDAAESAGISSENVTIALEPESASLYCQHLPATRTQNSLGKLPSGSKYLILDAGGGTVDITVHEIMPNGILREIHKATGGDWGGTKVDQAFENFLCEITGEGVLEKFRDNAMEDYLDLLRNFEVKKREAKLNSDRQTSIKIPVALIDQATEVTGKNVIVKISQSRYRDRVQLAGDKLRLDPVVMIGFFEESVKSITAHMESLFVQSQLQDCEAILMVGGFSESSVLQEKIKTHFPDRKIVVPTDAGLAVLKGAVLFGHNPALIAERICKYTYGSDSSHRKRDTCTHRKTNTFIAEGKTYCDDIFQVHVRAGDVVKVGERQEEQIFYPIYREQTAMSFGIYCTKERCPELITDEGCVKLGEVEIPIPETTNGCKRDVGISFLFGGTELEVKIQDKTKGAERKASLSFLG